ncbi:MAG: peptide chain release factor 1 [Verrucomicrobiota bacterium]|nr:peptide chain release factor 1 [Verrucomicrobiota bacterium]
MIEKASIDRLLKRLPELEAELTRPGAAANQKTYRALVREHTRLRRLAEKADAFFGLRKDILEHNELSDNPGGDPELRELARQEIGALETKLKAAEKELLVALLPPDPNENRNAIMEVRAGTGGDEAALFAGDLFRMYNKHIQSRGWKIGLIDAHAGEVGGYKEIVFSVEGDGAYAALRYESGGHRVQRVPATETQGRIHTSAATVGVFPEVEADDDIEIKPDEIRVDIFCSSGPGGQSVNTTYSAVRITHVATGIVAQSQDERSQRRNRDKAMAVLKARLLDKRRREEEEKIGKTRRSLMGSGDRSERIRTYNFPQNRMTDHRINLTLYALDRIMEGNLAELLGALLDYDLAQRLEEELKPAGKRPEAGRAPATKQPTDSARAAPPAQRRIS